MPFRRNSEAKRVGGPAIIKYCSPPALRLWCFWSASYRKGNESVALPVRSLTLINIPFRTINYDQPSLTVSLQQMKPTVVMKKILLIVGILASMAIAHVVFAQTSEGVITYESRFNAWKRVPPERLEAVKARVPEYIISKAELFYNGTETMYKPVVEAEEDAQFRTSGGGPGGGGFRFRMMGGGDIEIYVNHVDQIRLSQQEFNGKKYLITDTIQITPWKFGAETKSILGFTCKQAFYKDEERKMEVVAWYTDKLGMLMGPEMYGSLPGVILALDVNNGERTMVALSVVNKKLGKNDIKAPSGGTPISGEDFRAMVREEMQKRGANGPGRTVIIGN